jgi:hypothetical protein
MKTPRLPMQTNPEMITGIGWYSPDQWAMLKLLADDSAALDSSYEAWMKNAENVFQTLQGHQSGVRPVRIHIDVEVLRTWCRDHGYGLDAPARAKFITEQVKKTYG